MGAVWQQYDALYDSDGSFIKYPPEYGSRLYELVPADKAAPAPADPNQFDHYPDHPLPVAHNNSYEASRQSRVWARALQLLELGYSYDNSFWYDTYQVFKPGRITPSYEVCPHTWRCACPDYRGKGNYCKHTLALYAWIEACKRKPHAAKLIICNNAEHTRHEHRFIAAYVRRVAATLFRQA